MVEVEFYLFIYVRKGCKITRYLSNRIFIWATSVLLDEMRMMYQTTHLMEGIILRIANELIMYIYLLLKINVLIFKLIDNPDV